MMQVAAMALISLVFFVLEDIKKFFIASMIMVASLVTMFFLMCAFIDPNSRTMYP